MHRLEAQEQENNHTILEKDINKEFTRFIQLYIKAPFIRRGQAEKE